MGNCNAQHVTKASHGYCEYSSYKNRKMYNVKLGLKSGIFPFALAILKSQFSGIVVTQHEKRVLTENFTVIHQSLQRVSSIYPLRFKTTTFLF